MTASRNQAFDLEQLALVRSALRRGEALVARGFRIPALPSHRYPYELVTLADLKGPERAMDALAHLVVYERSRPRGLEHLYRICLQDDLILQRADEGAHEGWLEALLIYILTHELVHVVRFQRNEGSFMAAPETRQQEEDRVHELTLALLKEQGPDHPRVPHEQGPDQTRSPHWERLDRLCGNPVEVVVVS